MTFVPQSNGQGALFELVARGQKDTFFLRDGETGVNPFDNAYAPSVPFLTERKTIVPLNAPKFGNSFEIEIDKYGDILTECAFLIELPTWLPPLPTSFGGVPTNPALANGKYQIRTNPGGKAYGYVNYIGYLLFEKIQFYQDQILLQEWSGESLMATQLTEGSWGSSFMDQVNAGMTQPGDAYLASRATPGRLRVRLPIPGLQTPGDGGFPICCVPSQNYRFRIRLRNLEQIVVCSDPTVLRPAPWTESGFRYTFPTGQEYPFVPLAREQIGQPTILLETVMAYVPNEVMSGLQERTVTIPFRKVFENVFTIGEQDYRPLDTAGIALLTRRLDARHLAERILWMFRSGENIDRGRLDNFFNDYGPSDSPSDSPSDNTDDRAFYNEIKLVIAGQDREAWREPFIWQDIEALVNDERDNGLGLGEMRWNLGDVYERLRPAGRQPEGGINFTTADRPTLHINLRNVPPRTQAEGQRQTELRVFVEVWAIYETQEGRGRLVFGA
jgi:hypothetical protein